MSLWIDNQVTKYMVCNNVPIYNEDSHVTQEFEVEVEDNYIQITILEPSSVSGWNEGFSILFSTIKYKNMIGKKKIIGSQTKTEKKENKIKEKFLNLWCEGINR